jgi:uncharacterized protein YlxP (DUF503 family)
MGIPIRAKVIGRSKYKYVVKIQKTDGTYVYQMSVLGVCMVFDTEREAALKVDKMLISKGKEPVNILKRV